ncbi:alpha/beta fold hydrolase [Actinophytocola algeriensis]|uniref:Pimeloyl-ACP methyl ester carboxylesterase n=1 Tax=Actinophytocola algeriensis TaxID=1768010 RepID=A0A7W7Q227_9PSEU|nr:alpha/beta hydrolase [Actinophytocola algeriensis]MBB4905574.1 pimeloyl-ACP methyl ester carboxylesterase [Actinophytocola algeriensis]MBE1472741.1 pimeloyl-ACP methyl ester carboxylesterase [Actinophytocola algeriensis]
MLDGITATRVTTPRLTAQVLSVDGRAGDPVVFVHGNVSSSLFWQRQMLDLPAGYRPLAVDLRGFGGTDPLPVDATRGLRDFTDDVVSLDLGPAHYVGWSMGGGVLMQLLRDHPALVRTLTLVNPVSPYGFGGTTGPEGTLISPDGAGAGAAGANPEFVQRLADGDRGSEQTSPRTIMNTFYVHGTVPAADEDEFVESMLTTRTGEDNYPGDSVPSDAWPGAAPGPRGVLNTMAPNHFRVDDLHTIDPKPPILWLRGADDQIVSDTSMFDLAHLGQLGAIPGWPGAETHAPQPMVTQTRAVLDRYAAAGGTYEEIVFPGTGHSPHVERPAEFAAAIHKGLTRG